MCRMRELSLEHHGVLGCPRLYEDVRYVGNRCGCYWGGRLMRRAGFQAIHQ